MALGPTRPVNERILLMGGPGAGKTRAWLSIAEKARLTKADTHFYVIDTDFAVDAMLWDGFPRLAESGMLTVETPLNFREYQEMAHKLAKQVRPNQDWMIVDLMSNAWEEVQNYYSEEIYGRSKADYFLQRRKEMKKDDKNFQPYDGWTDWNVIKPLYNEFMMSVLFKHRGHVLITAGIKPLDRKLDKKDLVQMFGHLGFKPEGEKRTAHAPRTVMLLTQREPDRWTMDTAKDREREPHVGTVLDKGHQFVKAYLQETAGWDLKQ